MPRYKISRAAEGDLLAIAEYGIETWGLEKSLAYRDELKDKFQIIAESPYRYQAVDHIRPGYRRYLYWKEKNRISIYYRIFDEYVEIMRLIGRQNLEGL